MKKAITIFLLFFIVPHCFAQIPVVEWTRNFRSPVLDDYEYLNQTSDGGCIIVSSLNEATYTICLRKLDAKGTLEWKKTYGEVHMAFAKFVQQTADGGYFVTGNASTTEYKKVGPQNGNISAFKTNSKGEVEWEQTLGTDFNDSGESGKQTKDGGYIVTGTAAANILHPTTSENTQNQILLIKLNSSGDVQWQKEIGGPEENASRDIQLTGDGGYIIAGYYKAYRQRINGTLEEEPYLDFSVIRCDSTGNVIWARTYGTKVHDVAVSIAQCKDGGFVVAGNTAVGSFNVDALILKIDSLGNELWSATFGDKRIDMLSQFVVDQNDEILAAGVAANEGEEEHAWLFKLNAHGTLKWNTYYKGPVGRSRFKGLIIGKDGHIITGGTSDSKEGLEAPYKNNQIWILKLK